jgi:hypothetical protein
LIFDKQRCLTLKEDFFKFQRKHGNGFGSFRSHVCSEKEKREVDFVLIKDNRPMALFETKEGDSEISPSGRYFGKSLGIPLYQIAHRPGRCEAFRDNCFKIPASKFLILTG